MVEDAELMAAARAMAARLAALPPASVRATKALIRGGAADLAGLMAEELVVFRARVASPEAGEAFAAFVEKRKPDFSGFE